MQHRRRFTSGQANVFDQKLKQERRAKKRARREEIKKMIPHRRRVGVQEEVCENSDPLCPRWASEGRCKSDEENMLKRCRRSCFVCCDDNRDSNWCWKKIFRLTESGMSREEACQTEVVHRECPKSCGHCREHYREFYEKAPHRHLHRKRGLDVPAGNKEL